MRIERRVYKVFYKGARFTLPIIVSVGAFRRARILVRSSKFLKPKA